MKRRLLTLLAIAIVMMLTCLLLVSCGEETIKDDGGAVILQPNPQDNNGNPPTPTTKTYTLTVNNGNGIKKYTYNQGDSVTVNADETDKAFLYWEFEASKVTENRSFTFTINNDVTLTAVYTDIYTVFLDADEGEAEVSSFTVLYGQGYTLPVPTLKNYYFLGWFYSSKAYTDDKGVSKGNYLDEENILLEAKYQEKPIYKVSVTNGDGASLVTNDFYYHLDEEVVISALAVEDRQSRGWLNGDGDVVTTDSSFTLVVKNNLTLVARYVEAYRVEVSGGNGQGIYEKGTVITVNFTVAASGKEFVGWKIDGEEEPFTNERSFTHVVNGRIKFVAVTQDKLYSISYKVDNVVVQVDYYKFNQTIIPLAEPTREHYTFSSWTGLPPTMKMPARDIEVTGVFNIDKFQVNVINGSGTGSYGWNSVATAVATEPIGQRFSRWVDGVGNVISTANPYSFNVTSAVTLTAEFTKINYILRYEILVVGEDLANLKAYQSEINKSVGGIYASFELNYGDRTVVVPGNISCEHYLPFSGWSDVPTTMPAHDLTIYGTFTIEKHTITVYNGLTGEETTNVYDYNQEISISATVPTGYIFMHWKVGANEIVSYTNPYVFRVSGNKAYTAYINKGVYLVEYYIKAVYESDFELYQAQSYDFDEPIVKLSSPVRANHYFGNWSEIPDRMPAGNVRVEGIFYYNKHTVSIVDGKIIKKNGESITPSTSGTFDYNDQLTIKSDTITGKYFQNWKSAGLTISSLEEYTFTLTGNISFTANFGDTLYNVIYILDGDYDNPLWQYMYKYDQVIAVPDDPIQENYHFSGWTLEGGGEIPSRMPAYDLICVGEFIIDQHEVTIEYGFIVAVDGVTLETPITGGPYPYDYGTEFTIQAQLPIGKWFKKWITQYPNENYNVVDTPYAEYNGEYVYTLSKDIHLSAIFVPSRHTLTVNNDGRIVGYEVKSAIFDYNTAVSVANIGNQPGRRFVEIRMDGITVTTSTEYSFYIQTDTEIEVVYEYVSYKVEYFINGAGYDNFLYSSEYYIYTDVIETLPHPDYIEHYSFGGWQLIGYQVFPSVITNLDRNIIITGSYVIDKHTVNLTNGKITKVNGADLQTPLTQGTYDYGTSINIKADTIIGQYFVKWINDGGIIDVSTENEFTFGLGENVNYSAVYNYYDYEVKYYIIGAEYEENTPYLDTEEYLYHYGDSINYLDSPEEIIGYVFIGWYDIEGNSLPISMPDVDGRIINAYGRYEHIYSYELNDLETGYIVSRSENVSDDIYPSSIILPETYNGLPVVAVAPEGFVYLTTLTSVTVGDNILEIGQGSFRGCSNLQTIGLPFIGKNIDATGAEDKFEYIFDSLVPVSLTTVIIASDTAVGDYAFADLIYLEEVVLPNVIETIGSHAFYGCAALTSVNLPEGLISIGNNAFASCVALLEITIPSTVTDIGDDAFSGCSNVANIYYNAILLNDFNQANYVFNLRANNLNIIIGSTVTAIPAYLFYPVPVDLETPTTLANSVNVEFLSDDGIYSVTSIGAYAFFAVPITSISLPTTVTTIGVSAFERTDLTSLSLGASITEIGSRAFAEISNLNLNYGANITNVVDENTVIFYNTAGQLTIANNLSNIADYLFCNAAFSFVIFAENSQCISIGSYAFANNENLISIQIPSSVETIGGYAFANTKILSEIYFDAAELNNLTALSEVFCDSGIDSEGIVLTIGSSVLSIPEYLFYSVENSANVIGIVIEEGGQCVLIGKFAFYNLNNLVTVEQFELVRNIGESAFENCSGITEIVISAATRYIGTNAFANCSSIEIKCEVYAALGGWATDWKDITAPIEYNYNTIVNGDYIYALHGGKAFITKYNGLETEITVPAEIDSYTVMCFGNTYEGNENIVSIVIPDGIHQICDYAFSNCYSLTTVTYLGDINFIGKYAFNNCGSLTTFAIPPTITEISEGTFYNCSSLISVSGNKLNLSGISIIGEKAFYGCEDIEEITLSDLLSEIKAQTFAYCTSLIGITIPANVTIIAQDAFLGCAYLGYYLVDTNNIYFSASDGVLFNKDGSELIAYPVGDIRDTYEILSPVSSIAPYAFSHAVNLVSITIPNTVTVIGTGAFEYCVNLVTINYNAIDALTDNTCLFVSAGKEGSGIIITFGSDIINIPDNLFNDIDAFVIEIIFGENLLSIGQGAFVGAKITNITLPESLISIGNDAFRDTVLLETINYNPISLNNLLVDNGAFALAGTLSSGIIVYIGANVISIPDYIFSAGSDYEINIIELVYLSDALESIGKYAFYQAKLTEILITENVTFIGEKAFGNNTLVDTLNFNATLLSNSLATDNIFQNLGSALDEENYVSVIIGENVKNIPDYFAYNLIKVNFVTINSLELLRVGQFAFKGTSIVEITLPDGITEIGASAFENLNFSSLILPDSITTIGNNAFAGMNIIDSLTLPENLSIIGEGAFNNWEAITEITIPESVTRIGINAFGNATGLIIINYNAVSVADLYGNRAFDGAGSEASPVTVNIGSAVERIPNYLFVGCDYIQSVIFSGNENLVTIGEKAFYMLENLVSVVDLPSSVTSVGVSAFEGCILLTVISLTANTGNLIISDSAFSGCIGLVEVILASDSTLTAIGARAFYDCISLVTIDFGTEYILENIGDYAFYNCIALDLTLPSSIKNTVIEGQITGGIGISAFENCESLTSITIPNEVIIILEGAFKNCISLTTVVMHSNIEYIGESAFEGCTALSELTVPEKVTHIGNKAFYNCAGATTINYLPVAFGIEMENTENNNIFGNVGVDGAGADLVIGASVKKIPSFLFYGTLASSPKIISIVFETVSGMSSVQEIGIKAFYYAKDLQILVLPEGLLTIQDQAFANCLNLEQLTIPSSVTLIKYRAFANLNKLTDLVYNAVNCSDFNNDNTEINKTEVFIGMGNYSDEFYTNEGVLVIIGNLVETIPENMFYSLDNRAKIKEVVLELTTNLVTISNNAFFMQESLTTISNIGTTILIIGESAFYGCSSFVSAEVMEYATTVKNEAFYNCASLPALYLATNLETLGNTAVYMDCSSVENVYVNTTNLPRNPFVGYNTIFKGVGGEEGFILHIAENVNYIPDHFMHNFENFGIDGEIGEWTINIIELNIANPGIEIGDYAFAGVGKLTDVVLGITEADNIYAYIGDYAFYRCPDIIKVTLGNVMMKKSGDALLSTHTFAYSSVEELETVNFMQVPEIGPYAFYHCENLSVVNQNHDIVFRESVGWGYCDNQITTIGVYAFAYSGLVDVYLSAYISDIGAHAFEGCENMTTFRWPDNVLTIGDYAFYNCTSLAYTTNISFDMENEGTYMTNYVDLFEDGGMGTIIGKVINTLYIGYPMDKKKTVIRDIGEYAFKNTQLNISIELFNNLENVDLNAFTDMLGELRGVDFIPVVP